MSRCDHGEKEIDAPEIKASSRTRVSLCAVIDCCSDTLTGRWWSVVVVAARLHDAFR